MSDHLVSCVDTESQNHGGGGCSSSQAGHQSASAIEVSDEQECTVAVYDEQEPLIQNVECRICQEEDGIKNLETPCACSGSLKYAHRKCVQKWCNEKGDITCEICHQPYQHGYTAPAPRPRSDETAIDISDGWTVSDPRILAMAAAERRYLDAEYDEYADHDTSGAAFCRSAALVLMALLLLRHALYLTNGGDDEDEDDTATFVSLFFLRVAGFLLPCYIMAWTISIVQRWRHRQEAAAVAASDVAFMIHATEGNHHGLHITIEPGQGVTPLLHQEPPHAPAHSLPVQQ